MNSSIKGILVWGIFFSTWKWWGVHNDLQYYQEIYRKGKNTENAVNFDEEDQLTIEAKESTFEIVPTKTTTFKFLLVMMFQNTFLLGLGNKKIIETPILRSKKSNRIQWWLGILNSTMDCR